jgi:hypothetical protein
LSELFLLDFCAGGAMGSSPLGSIREVLAQENASEIFIQVLDFYESVSILGPSNISYLASFSFS